MARLLRILTVGLLVLLPLVVMVSQQDQAAAGDAINPEQGVGFLTLTPTLIPSMTYTIDPENTPEPTPFPTAAPQLTADVLLVVDVRRDLELFADDQFGPGVRPLGWNLAVSQYDPQIVALTRGDLELMATALINADSRPSGWTGAFPSTPYAIARDTRHDLELLADRLYGKTRRPTGWIGGDPLLSCNRSTQTLVNLLERGGIYRLQLEPNNPDFCRDAELDVSKFVETQILANAQIGNLFNDQVALLSSHQITTNIAVGFLDSRATRQVGTIPNGTPIQVIARSTVQFSKMMLVSGTDFQLFVEYTNTSVTEQQFRALPNFESLEISPYCFTDWCRAR